MFVGEAAITPRISYAVVCLTRKTASFFFRSALAARRRSTRVLAFVVFERRLVMRLRPFAPLRAKITSSAQSLVLPSGRPSQESSLPILTSFDHLVGAGEQRRWN